MTMNYRSGYSMKVSVIDSSVLGACKWAKSSDKEQLDKILELVIKLCFLSPHNLLIIAFNYLVPLSKVHVSF